MYIEKKRWGHFERDNILCRSAWTFTCVRIYAGIGKNKGKDSRIKLNKINDYIQALSVYGTEQLTENYVKHLDGDIWELRPLRDRILFAGVVNGRYVLLHQFVKKTQKTPPREIEQAKRELADFKERCDL